MLSSKCALFLIYIDFIPGQLSRNVECQIMKILVTSDTHGNLEGLDISTVDVICFAGDIAPLHGRGKWHVYD